MSLRRIVIPMLAAALALAAGAVSAPARGASKAERLVGRILDAYGGRAALDSVRAYRMEGVLFAIMRHDESNTVRIFDRPGRLKILISYPDGAEVRIVDGPNGWRNAHGGPVEPASGPMRDAMVLQAARAGVPWILADHAAEARTVKPLVRDGVRYDGIEFPLGEGLVFRAYADRRTHRVHVSQGELDHGGMKAAFETVYDDFRDVDGVLFAFREENWASGMKTGITTLDRIELNPAIGVDEFVPPDVGDASDRRDDG